MDNTKSILLVGVGGQGTILASKVLSEGLVEAGYDVKMSEIHGMAQRGGSVSTQVRFGDKVFSPIIGKGEADILVSFETMEALRWLEYLKPDGKVVVNDYKIPSAPILMGKEDYPEGVIDIIKDKANTSIIDAAKIAEDLGNTKVMNIVLFGALVKAMGLTDIDWEDVIRKTVKEKFVDINIKAFNAGMNAIAEASVI
ncbi:indolepyruvate oxidoreductase subunit beta [Anaerosalibacter bizertensis]|uniref:Indolepyruvate oxidoreductase subunit beta n=1 Tax=Anaerosalibacter bizertensis TaxID=932217 RepID=A0A9Q4AD87_9FIRM|nr:indolepyruvate oxidoreductase subunit beta [Anaerosalibacter bizertensis]MBV1820060.1 indolepyruvate oxidoreductase subunit beta [Bacteroidales bacterium MSK.15.36]MCB5558968.1 indolepyruvate oxidoreductase subunit beta [Anaerosalibacter bizertensis]MCG4565274.1 indolepyruvate oxidoreductase subunit beta [Anaerosalibacter bizertensis]MCG4582586.1 indolepyruvate oxidoreductase subunit beta [Anaerosalibacter bizertensis]MCG4584992.1 indolepyruvate oxidoreductase subunit beta [Anaerosalibacter